MYTSAEDESSALAKSNMFSLTGSKFLGAVGRSLDLGMHNCLTECCQHVRLFFSPLFLRNLIGVQGFGRTVFSGTIYTLI